MNQTYTVDEVIAAFSDFDGAYRRDHVDAALAMRTEITPRLIELLEMVRREPARFADNADFAGHTYAVMLLGYFGEPRAHQVIIDLLHLPKNPIERLFGELISEEMPNILYRTCGGSLEQIRLLAQDRKAYEYSRGAALSALTFAHASSQAAVRSTRPEARQASPLATA